MSSPFESVPGILIAAVATGHCACFAFITDVVHARESNVLGDRRIAVRVCWDWS